MQPNGIELLMKLLKESLSAALREVFPLATADDEAVPGAAVAGGGAAWACTDIGLALAAMPI